MRVKATAKRSTFGAVTILGVAAASYAAYAGTAWLGYGHPPAPRNGEADALLDLFMPTYNVVDRHRIDVTAPAAVTFEALMRLDLQESLVIRAIFKGRQLLLGAEADANTQAKSLVEATKALGWVVLAEVPGHEIVMGAVTKPWEPNVVFRGVPAEQFAAFDEPEYVKIVWTLRADAVDPSRSIARTETRAVATDADARAKFRRYLGPVLPGHRLDSSDCAAAREAGCRTACACRDHDRVPGVEETVLRRARRAIIDACLPIAASSLQPFSSVS